MSVTRGNLGSVEATSAPSGYFQNRMNFDAWGNRQSEGWTRGTPTISSSTKQGYTGHEQLDAHKLVHMQGRVYDPALGRFLSADLLVLSPHSTQSFNRYSYVSNNPLSRIDPTGYQEVGSNGRSGDGTDYSDKGDEIVVTGTRDSCASGATCLTGGEADSYLRDMLAMQTFTFDAFMGIGNAPTSAPTPQQQLDGLGAKLGGATRDKDGSWRITDGKGNGVKFKIGDKNGKGISLNSGQAFEHFKNGSGTPKRISFDQVDTSRISVKDFKQVKGVLSEKQIGLIAIDSRLAFTTSGDNFLMLGNITLRLQGSLAITEKNWNFDGTLKSFDDVYDFNASSHRSVIGELLTTFGRNTEGTPFSIEIRGDKSMQESGSF